MRIRKLKQGLKRQNKFPYLIADLVNIRYLTGFRGSNGFLLVNGDRSYFISDSRYEEYARSILPRGVEFVLQKSAFTGALKEVMKRTGGRRMFVEEHAITLSQIQLFKKELRGIRILPGGDEVNLIRLVKEEGEIDVIRKAVTLADDCFRHLLKMIRPGMLEWDLAVEIEYFYRKHGCRRSSFDSIVAAGKGSSMPHYATSMTRRLRRGDILMIDMGCEYDGYNSDLTRTVFLHSVAADFEMIYGIVRRAQERALKALRPGITAGQVDKTARDVISGEGYDWAFGHSLGHGVGLEVHELPAVKPGSGLKLKKNMVITIEPGIYIPGRGGVRIEDMALVTGRGCEILTESPKDIIIL